MIFATTRNDQHTQIRIRNRIKNKNKSKLFKKVIETTTAVLGISFRIVCARRPVLNLYRRPWCVGRSFLVIRPDNWHGQLESAVSRLGNFDFRHIIVRRTCAYCHGDGWTRPKPFVLWSNREDVRSRISPRQLRDRPRNGIVCNWTILACHRSEPTARVEHTTTTPSLRANRYTCTRNDGYLLFLLLLLIFRL